MPFVSKAQERKFKQLEDEGRMTKGTAEKWRSETRNFDALPDRTKPKQPTKAIRSSPPRVRDFGWYR